MIAQGGVKAMDERKRERAGLLYGYLDESPGYEEKIREEEWAYGSREVDHVYETDEEGNTHLVRYTRQYGYEHRLVYPAGQLLDFEVVTSEVIYL